MNLFEYFASQTKSCLFTHALWPTLSAKSILLWCWPQASMAIASTSHINHHHPRIHWIWAGFEWTRKIKLAGLKMKTEIQATNLTKFSLHVFQMLIPSLQEKFLLNAHVSQTLPKPIISCGFTFAKKNWRNVKNLTLLFKNRIPILPSSSHPFVLPLKKNIHFSQSPLWGPQPGLEPPRQRTSASRQSCRSKDPPLATPERTQTWPFWAAVTWFFRKSRGWKQRFSEISKHGSLAYKWWSLMIGNCSDCSLVWVKHQHSRPIGHHLCTSKLENTSSLNCLETILSGKFLQIQSSWMG